MTNQVTLTIDGVQVSVPAGTLIVDAAKKAGIDIPVFCYHPKMEPAGMCRMCLVRITSYNVCYTKLLRVGIETTKLQKIPFVISLGGQDPAQRRVSYNFV